MSNGADCLPRWQVDEHHQRAVVFDELDRFLRVGYRANCVVLADEVLGRSPTRRIRADNQNMFPVHVGLPLRGSHPGEAHRVARSKGRVTIFPQARSDLGAHDPATVPPRLRGLTGAVDNGRVVAPFFALVVAGETWLVVARAPSLTPQV